MHFDQTQFQIDQQHRNEMMRQAENYRLAKNTGKNASFVTQVRNQVGQFLTRTGHDLQERYDDLQTAASTSTITQVEA